MGIIDNKPVINHGKFCGTSYNAVQINMQKPTVNAPAPQMIYDYPQAGGQIYYPPMQKPVSFGQNKVIRTPSGADDYENYIETNADGDEIASVKYSKEGNILVQNLKTKSPDGTMLEKTLKNSDNIKTSHITIKDKDGNLLFTKEKTYQKVDEDTAQTILNGDVYNISGLKGNIITVEHNGKKTEINLDKMLNPDVKILKMNTSPENFNIRDKKITDEEKEKLFNRIKSLGGDDLIRLSKSVEHLQLLDEKSIESFYVDTGKTLLLSPKDWGTSHMVTEHELGHAITYSVPDENNLISDNEQFINIRNYEKENFKNNTGMTSGDKLFGSKFMFGNPDYAWEIGDKDGEEANLRNETFAECYNNLNNMDIIRYDDEVLPMRTLSLFKYLPRTLAVADKLSQI